MNPVIATDVIVIGTGPAGWTAALYLARANYQPVVLTGPQTGGQLTTTMEVENWPGGNPELTGPSLMLDMERQVRDLGVEVRTDIVTTLQKSQLNDWPIEVVTETDTFVAKSVIIATGSSAKYLGLASEEEFKGRGVSACATCDGFFYRGKPVMVVGGGNTAVEEALYLSNIASKVTLLVRGDKLRAEHILQTRLKENEKIEVKYKHEVNTVLGDASGVTGVIVDNGITDDIEVINVDGVFIAIGHEPNTSFMRQTIGLKDGYVVTYKKPDGSTTGTNVPGVFAAGDVADPRYRQAITSAGSGCMAALDAIKYLENLHV